MEKRYLLGKQSESYFHGLIKHPTGCYYRLLLPRNYSLVQSHEAQSA